ncbi:helix-turn-helix domain-containing protein [Parafrankia sp. FMc2]|uniref:helix-turn-helix domain-containing protein n=1 Tax=Parafrankia sp. FMc2 TaxID=3233196 RepID=UPI0034D3F9ED
MADRRTPVYRARGPVNGEDWAAVASALNERMARRRIGQQDLARISGVSVSTLRELQHGAGRRVQNKTLVAIAQALEWPDDHLIQVLVSEPPVAGTPDEPTGREILAALVRVEERLTEITSRLAAVEQAVTRAGSRTPS